MKIALFGGSGFVGANLVNLDYYNDYTIFGTQKMNKLIINNKEFKYVNTDYKAKELSRILKNFDCVINLSTIKVKKGISLRDYYKINVKNFENLLKACINSDVNNLINMSTRMVYDNSEVTPWSENNTKTVPNTYYGLSKVMADILLEEYNESYKAKFKSMRISQVYGLKCSAFDDKQNNFIFQKFIKSALENKPLIVNKNLENYRDYIYIKDLIKSIKLCIDSDKNGIFNIGSGVKTNNLDVAKLVNKIFNPNNKIITNRYDSVNDKVLLDISKAKKELGFRPEYSVENGLKDMKMILGV